MWLVDVSRCAMETTRDDRNSRNRARNTAIQLETEEGHSTRQEQTTNEVDKLLKSLSPLINSMKPFGVYFTREPLVRLEASNGLSCRSLKKCPGWNPARVYATIMLVVIWLNAVRFFVVFEGMESIGLDLLIKIAMISNVLHIVVLHTAYYVASHTGSLCRVFRQVNSSIDNFSPKYSRRAKVVTVVCWILVALNMCWYINSVFSIWQHNDPTLLIFGNIFHLSKPYEDIVNVVFIVVQLQSEGSWMFTQAMKNIYSESYCIFTAIKSLKFRRYYIIFSVIFSS